MSKCFLRLHSANFCSPGTGWKNVEYRSFRFADETGDNASIIETEESKKARSDTEIPLTETERMQLEKTVKRTNEEGGRHPLEAKV